MKPQSIPQSNLDRRSKAWRYDREGKRRRKVQKRRRSMFTSKHGFVPNR